MWFSLYLSPSKCGGSSILVVVWLAGCNPRSLTTQFDISLFSFVPF